MQRLIHVNDVLVFGDKDTTERILWIDSSYTYAFTLDLHSHKLKINHRRKSEIEEKIEEQKAYFNYEGYKSRLITSNNISDAQSKLLNDAWEIIKLIAQENNEPNIYIQKHRNELVKKAATELNVCRSTVYKYLKKY